MYIKNIVKSYLKSCVPRFQMTTTVREQHPRSHHTGATSMQTQQAVRVLVGFKLATNSIQFYVFCH